jgi:predicted N-formylglutamate amidohydrolase
MAALTLRRRSAADPRLLLTCEHASAHVPEEYGGLGLEPADLAEHIAWDIGAGAVTEELSSCLEATAVLSRVSRLVVDCNRDLADHDLMAKESHGTVVPGNASIGAAERERRLRRFYFPYHEEIDRRLRERRRLLLLSIHSFTPSLNGRERRFDVGVLHDDFATLAEDLAAGIASAGLAVRMNEPYSALDGLIFSARHHGQRSRVPYLELEINNRLLQSDMEAREIARLLAGPLSLLPRPADR